MTNQTDQILSHYHPFWGEPKSIYESGDSRLPIQVAEFSGENSDSDWVYATLGLSQIKIETLNFKGLFRSEIFAQSQSTCKDLINALFSLSWSIQDKKLYIDEGHTLKGIVEGAPDINMEDGVILKPSIIFDQSMNVIHTSEYHAKLLWLLPIHRNERNLVVKEGLSELINRFSDVETNTSNLKRASVI